MEGGATVVQEYIDHLYTWLPPGSMVEKDMTADSPDLHVVVGDRANIRVDRVRSAIAPLAEVVQDNYHLLSFTLEDSSSYSRSLLVGSLTALGFHVYYIPSVYPFTPMHLPAFLPSEFYVNFTYAGGSLPHMTIIDVGRTCKFALRGGVPAVIKTTIDKTPYVRTDGSYMFLCKFEATWLSGSESFPFYSKSEPFQMVFPGLFDFLSNNGIVLRLYTYEIEFCA